MSTEVLLDDILQMWINKKRSLVSKRWLTVWRKKVNTLFWCHESMNSDGIQLLLQNIRYLSMTAQMDLTRLPNLQSLTILMPNEKVEFTFLTNLIELQIDNRYVTGNMIKHMTQLKSLGLRGYANSLLTPVSYLTNLEKVTLRGCDNNAVVKSLKMFPNLIDLSVENIPLWNVLHSQTNINPTRLSISCCDGPIVIVNLTSRLENLTSLRISYSSCFSIYFLATLTNLTELYCKDIGTASKGMLSHLPNLTYINLDSVSIDLQHQTQLRQLCITNTPIRDINFNFCTNLSKLSIGSHGRALSHKLCDLTNLTSLSICDSDELHVQVSSLTNLTALTKLKLFSSLIKFNDLTPYLTNLTRLVRGQCKVTKKNTFDD